MEINKYFLLKVWLLAMLIISMVRAFGPDMNSALMSMTRDMIVYDARLFWGTLVTSFAFSTPIFICLYLLLYTLTRVFEHPAILLKSILFILCLVMIFMTNYICFPYAWFGLPFVVYSIGVAAGFCIFDVYQDQEYLEFKKLLSMGRS